MLFHNWNFFKRRRNPQIIKLEWKVFAIKAVLVSNLILMTLLILLNNGGLYFKDIFFRGQLIVSKMDILDQFYQLDSSISIRKSNSNGKGLAALSN